MAAARGQEPSLNRKLRDSRHRFQRRMQQLIEKYSQPFEDAPLVEMSTLTYQTSQGLRLWGGRLIQEHNTGHAQVKDTPVTLVSWGDGPRQFIPTGSKSDDVNETYDQEDEEAVAVTERHPTVPQSPLKHELRRKYLTQVDILLQDGRCSQSADDEDREDTKMALTPLLATSAHGGYSGIYAKNPEGPANPKPSLQQSDLSTTWAVVPRNDSLVSQGASSFLSNQSFEVEDICNVTISDLYEGMLHSMSRLLTTKPSCIISTKTLITQDWSCRRRAQGRSRVSRMYRKEGRPAHWGSRAQQSPCSQSNGEPNKSKDLLCISGREMGFRLKRPLQEVNTPQVHEPAPSWKGLTVTPRKFSSSRYLDSSAIQDLDQQNRIMTLKWLISPIKLKSRSSTLPRFLDNRQRKIEVRFDKLYRQYCPGSWSQHSSADSWAMDIYRGGPTSLGCLQGFENRRLSLPDLPRLPKGLGRPDQESTKAGGCLPKPNPSSSLLSKTDPAQCTGHRGQTLDTPPRGSSPEVLKRSQPPAKANSQSSVQPLGWCSSRYSDIKEKFNKLHHEYSQRAPLQKETVCPGRSPDGAIGKNQCNRTFQVDTGTGRWSPRKSPSSPQPTTRKSLGSTGVESHPLACIPHIPTRDDQSPAKRCRLSDSLVCGQWPVSWNSAGVSRAVPTPREVSLPLHLPREQKEKRPQDRRDK